MILDDLLFNSRIIIAGGVVESILEKVVNYKVGGITLGTYSNEVLSTHPPPLIAKVFDDCIINAYGIRKTYQASKDFVKKIIKKAKANGILTICSFVEKNYDQIPRALEFYGEMECDIIEFNPTPLLMSGLIKTYEERKIIDEVGKVIEIIKRHTSTPISIKFPSIIHDVPHAWNEWKSRGAKIAHIMNALIPAMLLTPLKYTPLFKNTNGIGGLTGRCIKPISIAKVSQLKSTGESEIIGTGGVIEPMDVKEMLMVGAKAVGIHSVLYLRDLPHLEKLITATKE